jgi:hypothetical protein
MAGWNGGYLHERCLEKRLGRKLSIENDFLLWVAGHDGKGGFNYMAHPDYWHSPEYLEH